MTTRVSNTARYVMRSFGLQINLMVTSAQSANALRCKNLTLLIRFLPNLTNPS